MSLARVFLSRCRNALSSDRFDRELDAELQFHLQMQIDDNVAGGMDPEEAKYAALRSFGRIAGMKQQHRERRAFASIESFAQDMRYALRTLRKSSGFTITAAATLGLGIGVNTAMFSVVQAVLLAPLPFLNPEQLVMVWTQSPGQGVHEGRSAYWNVEEWRRQARSFIDLAVFDGVSLTLTGQGEATQISAARVSPNFFSLLGITPLLGRVFSTKEAEQRQRLALISYRFWQSRFNGSPDAIGATIELDGSLSVIVGILSKESESVRFDADVWEAHSAFPDWDVRRAVRGADSWFVVGRLRPNVALQEAQLEMQALAYQVDAQLSPAERGRGISLTPLSDFVIGTRSRLALWMLTAAISCVLVIALANVASLALARGIGRSREIAVRTALGAGPSRIARQLLAESITLGIIAGLGGWAIAAAAIQLLRVLKPVELPRLENAELDVRVFGCALVLSLVTGVLTGLAPALVAWRSNLRSSTDDGGRSETGGTAGRGVRRALVVAEFAVAMVLITSAGVLVRSWWRAESIDPGFRTERVLSMQVRAPLSMSGMQRSQFYEAILQRIETTPGVEAAGFIGDLFLTSNSEQNITTESSPRVLPERVQFRRDEVSAGLFKTLGTALRKGRFFDAGDGPDAPRVAVLNETMARRLWPSGEPIGRRFKLDEAGPWFTVVGVVEDMRRQGLEREPFPQMFEPIAQNPSGAGSLLIRTSGDNPLQMAPAIRAAVHAVHRRAPLYSVATLESRLGAYLAPRRFQTGLIALLSGIALAMAAIGIYGLIQYSIATRVQEIGIRMAIGAQSSDIFRMVITEGLKLSFTGLALGWAGAILAGELGSSLLFGVKATDPLSFATVSVVLTVVAVAACFIPALRATKIAPVLALRRQ